MNIANYFLIFMFYSIIGWIIEVVVFLHLERKFINRGFLIGTYCPIYGCGGLLITLTLTRYQEEIITLFIMSCFICATLEYLISYIMEVIFKTRWWDYSNNKFNLNGRVCLGNTIAFGFLGCLVVYFINPFIYHLFDILGNSVNVIAIIIGVIFIVDVVISSKIIYNFSKTTKLVVKDSTEEITKKVKEILLNKSILSRRLVRAFPKFKLIRTIKKKYNEKIETLKNK